MIPSRFFMALVCTLLHTPLPAIAWNCLGSCHCFVQSLRQLVSQWHLHCITAEQQQDSGDTRCETALMKTKKIKTPEASLDWIYWLRRWEPADWADMKLRRLQWTALINAYAFESPLLWYPLPPPPPQPSPLRSPPWAAQPFSENGCEWSSTSLQRHWSPSGSQDRLTLYWPQHLHPSHAR